MLALNNLRIAHVHSVALGIEFLLPQLKALQSAGAEVHGICGPGPGWEKLEKEAIHLHLIQVERRIAPIQDLQLLVTLIRLFKKMDFTLVHVHTAKLEPLGQLAARLAGVPVVCYTNHGFYFRGFISPLKKAFYRFIARMSGLLSDHIFTQAQQDEDYAIHHRIYPKKKVSYLGNGINIDFFNPDKFVPGFREQKKRMLQIPEHRKVVGMVGRYVYEKGYREFFEAAKILVQKGWEVHFLTIGQRLTTERDPVDFSLLQRVNLDTYFTILEKRDDMDELYGCMDVMVLPSYREGFPRVLMEASSMQVPVVASDISGCREAVRDGYNGFLVPPKDPRALAEKIEVLLKDESLRKKMGKTGRDMAKRHFDENKVVERLLKGYEELFKRKELI